MPRVVTPPPSPMTDDGWQIFPGYRNSTVGGVQQLIADFGGMFAARNRTVLAWDGAKRHPRVPSQGVLRAEADVIV